jgi:tocopherol O-methyltransferase
MKTAEFTAGVKEYYEENSARFAQHDSGKVDAFHRAVWAPDVQTPEESFNYVNRWIAEFLKPHAPSRLLDMGCGIGGSLFFLTRELQAEGVGTTISEVQAGLATKRARELQADSQCRFLEADYLNLPELDTFDAAIAIESFVHCADAGAFFTSAASVLKDDGYLIICDDFLTADGAEARTPGRARLLREFKKGWHVGSLVTPQQAEILAEEAGLTLCQTHDLTPYLRLGSAWDRLIAWTVMMGRRLPLNSPWWNSWLGGNAIQQCLKTGLVKFQFLVFRKSRE